MLRSFPAHLISSWHFSNSAVPFDLACFKFPTHSSLTPNWLYEFPESRPLQHSPAFKKQKLSNESDVVLATINLLLLLLLLATIHWQTFPSEKQTR